MILTMISSAFPFIAEAQEQAIDISGEIYQFGEKSTYGIDSSMPSVNAGSDLKLGMFSITGDIQRSYDKKENEGRPGFR